jgi:hypothetical protein
VNASFAARLPFEMLHRIRDVNLLAIDSRFFERAIHNFSRRSDKGFAGHILMIARLFTDQHNAASRGVAEKIGMQFERKTVFKGFPALVFAISREQWLANRAA